ncbi:MAG: hypothetical protein B7X08_00120 [Acidocella sp. 20-63-7]|nr:MAG: hypothetical protein B7X08_00120 [Acidocella sp. 20-63-7]HQT46029.1 hypothetical protein [Acidocella sp.]
MICINAELDRACKRFALPPRLLAKPFNDRKPDAMWKKIGIGFVVLLLLIAGAVWYLFSDLDSLVKTAIEKYGSAATRATVSVEKVDLSITSGAGTISGLDIGNPPGFSTAHALILGAIAVQLDTGSLAGSGPIVIKSINITRPQVTFELTGGLGPAGISTNSNLKAIQYNVQSYAGSGASSAAAQGGKPTRKEVINDLTVTGGQITIVAPQLTAQFAAQLKGKTLIVPLPPIHLTGIGQNSGGATAAQITNQVLGAITREATQVGTAALVAQLKGSAGGLLSQPLGGSKLLNLF